MIHLLTLIGSHVRKFKFSKRPKRSNRVERRSVSNRMNMGTGRHRDSRFFFFLLRPSWTPSAVVSFAISLLINSVIAVQHSYVKEKVNSPCSCPYSCITTRDCARRHFLQGTQEVLFYCGESGKICCPPIKHQNNIQNTEYEISRDDCFTADVQNQFANFSATKAEDRLTRVPISSVIEPVEPTKPPKNYFHVPSSLYVHTDDRLKNQQLPKKKEPASGRRPAEDQIKVQTIKPSSSQFSIKKQTSLKFHRNFRLLPAEANCGENNFSNRITEGEEASLGEYPWMVLTGVKDKYGNYRWNCGGTLINGWYVLTAAHCLIVDNRTVEFVRLGEHNLANATDCRQEVCLNPPEDVSVAEVIPHEKWNTTTLKNDIALIRLSRNPLLLGNPNIYPICLPVDVGKLNLTSTSKYEVAGWGKTDWNADEGSDVLRKATLSGVSRDECNICKDKKKQQYCPISNTQLCVQGWKAVDVCKGDSGGPLMVTRLNIYQVGITSFKGSEYCGAENIPSIFTKVENYMTWILDNIRE